MKQIKGILPYNRRPVIAGTSKSVVYSDCPALNVPVDVHRAVKNKDIVIAGDGNLLVAPNSSLSPIGSTLDWQSWLPFCAREYKISTNPLDYVLLPVIICPSGIPNRNGVGFPLEELCKWDSEIHQQVYRGWVGCPTYEEHANDDFKQARGVVIDSVLRKVPDVQGNIWKVLGLAAFDRTKYPELAARLLGRKTNDVSMGCMVSNYSCSICHKLSGSCNHINMRKPRDFQIDALTGKLAYRRCHGIQAFELSSVSTPAWTVCESPFTIDMSSGTAYK